MLQENITERELWSTKDKKERSRDHGIQVTPQHLENVAEPAQKSRHRHQAEVIRLEEA